VEIIREIVSRLQPIVDGIFRRDTSRLSDLFRTVCDAFSKRQIITMDGSTTGRRTLRYIF